MAGQQFTLFKGTLAGTDTFRTDPVEVLFASSLTLRVRLISLTPDTGQESVEVTLETAVTPTAGDDGWNEVDDTPLSVTTASRTAQEAWKVGAGTTTQTNLLSFVRASIVPSSVGGTIPVAKVEVHLTARARRAGVYLESLLRSGLRSIESSGEPGGEEVAARFVALLEAQEQPQFDSKK